ncbi:MAG: hypothetical protein KA735_04770 [Burkholderiaceae bacterium]|nr:hypothetical protein [Burkholderiaceae bacterium]
MTVQCVNCENFSLRNAGQMASQGYGHCSHDNSRAEFQSAVFQRNCHTFGRVDQDVAERRIDWLEEKKKQFLKGITA